MDPNIIENIIQTKKRGIFEWGLKYIEGPEVEPL